MGLHCAGESFPVEGASGRVPGVCSLPTLCLLVKDPAPTVLTFFPEDGLFPSVFLDVPPAAPASVTWSHCPSRPRQ